MENELDTRTNKIQAILKLEIAKDNLIGVSQALSEFNHPKIHKSIAIINEVLDELKKEFKGRF